MKNKDLIQQLQRFPMDMPVQILDVNLSAKHASDEPNSIGVYSDFGVNAMHSEEDLDSIREDYPKATNWIGLEFVSDKEEFDAFLKDDSEFIIAKGFIQAMDGHELWVNTTTDEMIKIKVKDDKIRNHFYNRHVKVTIEIMNTDEI